MEEAQRTAFQGSRIKRYMKEHWNSPRPQGLLTSELPFFELQWAADEKKAAVRTNLPDSVTEVDYQEHRPWVPPSEIRLLRQERCARRAWDTRVGHAYVQLGDVPPLPSQVRPGTPPKRLTIRGDIWHAPSEDSSDNDIRWLDPGTPLEGSVPKGASRYFAIQVDDVYANVTIELRAYTGDPDLFVSRRHTRPNPDQFTWVANKPGSFEELTVDFDDLQIGHPPAGRQPWPCYIGVFGQETSVFEIVTRLWRVRKAPLSPLPACHHATCI